MLKQLNPLPILIFGFAVTILIGVGASLFGIGQMRALVAQSEQIVNLHNRRADLAHQMYIAALERPLLLHAMVNTRDAFARDELFLQFRATGERFFRARNTLLSLDISPQEQRLLDAQNEQSRRAGTLQYQVIDLLNAGRYDAARQQLMDEAIPAQADALARMEDLIDFEQAASREALKQSQQRLDKSQSLLMFWGSIILLVVIVIGAFIIWRVYSMVALVGKSRDELAHLNQELHESEKMERAIRENTLEGIITIDVEGRIHSFNKAAEQMFGYQAHEVIHQPIEILIPEPHRSQHHQYISNYLRTGETHIIGNHRELQAVRKDGQLFPITLGVTEIQQGGQRIFVGAIRDITAQRNAELALKKAHDQLEERVRLRTNELRHANAALENEIARRKETQQQLEHLATHDSLTKLPNRNLFMEHLERTIAQASRRQQQTALLFIDLDGFKEVNDTQGHDTGDKLLAEIAQRFLDRTRAEDLLSRIGGDEFTLITGPSEVARQEAEVIARSLIETLQTPFFIDGNHLTIGASIGIAIFPNDSSSAEQLIQHADEAMYAIKKSGKNRYEVYQPS